MVLFNEDPVILIRETTNQFHIAPDRDSLSRIHESLSSLSTARSARIAQQQTMLRSLARKLAGLEEGVRWEEERHDAGGHAERMLRMDTDKFRVAKEVANSEIEEERLESELAALKAQAEALEREGVEGGEGGVAGRRKGPRDFASEDEVVLKLHIYRSLGVSAISDPNSGQFSKVIVQRRSSGSDKKDVNVIDLEQESDSRSTTAMIWDAM